MSRHPTLGAVFCIGILLTLFGTFAAAGQSSVRDIADNAIQIILDPQTGRALVPDGTILPRGLHVSVSRRAKVRAAKDSDAEPNENAAAAESIERQAVSLGRHQIVFQYVDRSDFDQYRPQFDKAIAATYARRFATAQSAGAHHPARQDSGSGYPTIVTYLGNNDTHTADIWFGSLFGYQQTYATSEISGPQRDYAFVDAGIADSGHLGWECPDDSSCGTNYPRDRQPNSYPTIRTTAYCWTDFGMDGSKGGTPWETTYEVDYNIYD